MSAATTTATPWMTVSEAAARARCGRKTLFRAIAAGRLRASRIDQRRAIRVHVEWLDAFLIAAATPAVVELAR